MRKNKWKSVIVKLSATLVLMTAPLMALTGISYADGTVQWTGNGVTNGQFDTVQCSGDTPDQGDVLWVFTASGANSATITINGQTSSMTQEGNGAFHFLQTGFNGDFATLSASATYTGSLHGNNTPILTISHGCPTTGGQGGGPQLDCDHDYDNSPASECTTPQPQKDCDGDYDNSPASDCTTPTQPQTDCDGDTDNSPATDCTTGGMGGGPTGGGTTTTTTTTGQVLGASTTLASGGLGAGQVSVLPQGSVDFYWS